MSRYDLSLNGDEEYEPGSDGLVLRNRRGIITVDEAEFAETELLTKAYLNSFDWVTASMRFTKQSIRDMHHLWLGDLYQMAGSYRTVNVSKGGFLFCPVPQIESEMNRFETMQLQELTPCRASSLDELAHQVSVIHAELLLIHPFREGNGRLARWLADLMILQAGFEAPVYQLNSEDQLGEYYSALRQGFAEDFSALTTLFEFWIRDGQSQS